MTEPKPDNEPDISDDMKTLSDSIQSIVENYLTQPDHKTARHVFFVAHVLARHGELLFNSVEHTYGIPPEAMEVAKKRLAIHARQIFAEANKEE